MKKDEKVSIAASLIVRLQTNEETGEMLVRYTGKLAQNMNRQREITSAIEEALRSHDIDSRYDEPHNMNEGFMLSLSSKFGGGFPDMTRAMTVAKRVLKNIETHYRNVGPSRDIDRSIQEVRSEMNELEREDGEIDVTLAQEKEEDAPSHVVGLSYIKPSNPLNMAALQQSYAAQMKKWGMSDHDVNTYAREIAEEIPYILVSSPDPDAECRKVITGTVNHLIDSGTVSLRPNADRALAVAGYTDVLWSITERALEAGRAR